MHVYTSQNETETPPHIEILGTILSDYSLYQDIKRKLSPEHFKEYAWLYKIIREVDESEGLTLKGVGLRLETQQIPILHEIRKAFVTENRLPALVKKVKEIRLAENLKRIAVQIVEECDEDNANDVLTELQTKAFELFTTDTEDLQDMEREVDDFAEWVESIMQDPRKAYGLLSGIEGMDAITTGWHKGDLVVLGARTSMGKSAFMIDNVLRIHEKGYKCAIFSLEMSKRQIYLRMMANLMNISLEVLRTGRMASELLPRFRETKKKLKGIYVDDTRGVDAEYIADVSRRLKRTQGLDFVVVDYLQDVKEKGEQNDNSGSAIGRICRKLRTAAQQLDVPIMALSQVTRAVEERKDKRPTNSDLSGSTGIETGSDVIALLYRDEYYNPETDKRGILEVNFTKQRNGKLGKVEVFYDKDSQKIHSLKRR